MPDMSYTWEKSVRCWALVPYLGYDFSVGRSIFTDHQCCNVISRVNSLALMRVWAKVYQFNSVPQILFLFWGLEAPVRVQFHDCDISVLSHFEEDLSIASP